MIQNWIYILHASLLTAKPLQLKLHLICSCQLCLPGKPPLFDHIIHLRPLKVCFWYQLHSLAYDLPLSALSGDSLILWSDWSGPDKSRLLIGQHHFAFWMSKMPLYLLYHCQHRLPQFLWSKSVVPYLYLLFWTLVLCMPEASQILTSSIKPRYNLTFQHFPFPLPPIAPPSQKASACQLLSFYCTDFWTANDWTKLY